MAKILSKSQSIAIGSILDRLGIDNINPDLIYSAEDLTEDEETPSPPAKKVVEPWKRKKYSSKSEYELYTPELLKSGKVRVKVPEWLTGKVAECVNKYEYAKAWYSEINRSMNAVFNNEDAVMALTVLATTSPQMDFSENLLLSVRILHAFKLDLKANPDKCWEFIDKIIPILSEWEATKKTLPKTMTAKDNAAAVQDFLSKKFVEYNDLQLPGVVMGRSMKSTWVNTVAMLRYFKSVNYSPTVGDTIKILISQLNSGKSGDKTSGNFKATAELISTHKVWSFVLNLLDPDNKMTEVRYNSVGAKIDLGPLYPVTIDTWMIRFMYNRYDDRDISLLKSDIFTNNQSKYLGMVSTVNKLAKQVGVAPDELQAICWLASIADAGEDLGGKTPESALQKNIDKIKGEGDFYRAVSTSLTDMLNYMRASKQVQQ